MDLAGAEVDAGQQADRAVALIFMLTCEGRMDARFGRQIRGHCRDRLDTRLLVVRDDRHRVAWPFLLRRGRRLLEDFHLAIDAQHLGHLFRKVGIAPFQVVSHFVRLHLLRRNHRASASSPLTDRDASIFQDARLQPFPDAGLEHSSDQPDQALVIDVPAQEVVQDRTRCPAPDWRGMHAAPPVHARERGGREAGSSTARGDSQGPSPSGTPATPATR